MTRIAERAEEYRPDLDAPVTRDEAVEPGGDAVPGSTSAEDASPKATFPEQTFPERTLTALWLLGRVPRAALPMLLLRPGRAGRGPGPDVREAAFLAPSGTTLAGDVEVHLRASDFARHGHATDPAYAGVVLHLCWEDDRPDAGSPTPLPLGGEAPTVALSSLLTAREVERLVALGPDVAVASPPCADARDGAPDASSARELVRVEGRRRLAERTWRAWRLADRYGFEGAFAMLIERAVASSAGRVRESEDRRASLLASIHAALGPDPVEALARRALIGRGPFVDVMRVDGVGVARAAELAWNAALPLVAALAAAYDDVTLARASAALADSWPSPRPYGRTRALAAALRGGEDREAGPTGALYAQGLLHLQDLWCARGGCGVCPLSGASSAVES